MEDVGMSVEDNVGENLDWPWPIGPNDHRNLECGTASQHDPLADDMGGQLAVSTPASTCFQRFTHPNPPVLLNSTTLAASDLDIISRAYAYNYAACPSALFRSEITQHEEEAIAWRGHRVGYHKDQTGGIYGPPHSHEGEPRYHGTPFVVPAGRAQVTDLPSNRDTPVSCDPTRVPVFSVQEYGLIDELHAGYEDQSSEPIPFDALDNDILGASAAVPEPFNLMAHHSPDLAPNLGHSILSATDRSTISSDDDPLLQVHHEDGTWTCGVWDCATPDKTYTKRSQLKKHQRCHEDKPFACERCGRRFRWESHLRAHRRSVHDKSHVYRCSSCQKKYYRKDNLARHIRLKHTAPVGDVRGTVSAQTIAPVTPQRSVASRVPNEPITPAGHQIRGQHEQDPYNWMANPMFRTCGPIDNELMLVPLQYHEGLFTPPMSRDASSSQSQLQSFNTASFPGGFLAPPNMMSPPTTPYGSMWPAMPSNHHHYSPPSTGQY
ncbi:PR domain [Recurvomyces mirabilis]|nr:PR domain [Recurvomyces mirabilis]